MRAYDLIRKKRDGGQLTPEELQYLVWGATTGGVADEQLAAFLMAVFFRGMDLRTELPAWLNAMLHSGRVLDLSAIPGRKVDKHSTGGVGDKISLALAPLVAVCGVRVPMVSGRSLGHTGGTLDKLESIPGFSVDLSIARFAELVNRLGVCLIGQTAEIAPADRKLYALRDATATIESVPLIASSILSKKLAAGIDALVLDVKVGRGAFMKTLEEARLLARTMVDLCKAVGRDCVALLTDMDAPLGSAVGNAVEVREAIDVLHGQGPSDVRELTLRLGVEMLLAGEAPGVGHDPLLARMRVETALADGGAAKRFAQLVEAQGGDPHCVEDPSRLPQPKAKREVAGGARRGADRSRRRRAGRGPRTQGGRSRSRRGHHPPQTPGRRGARRRRAGRAARGQRLAARRGRGAPARRGDHRRHAAEAQAAGAGAHRLEGVRIPACASSTASSARAWATPSARASSSTSW